MIISTRLQFLHSLVLHSRCLQTLWLVEAERERLKNTTCSHTYTCYTVVTQLHNSSHNFWQIKKSRSIFGAKPQPPQMQGAPRGAPGAVRKDFHGFPVQTWLMVADGGWGS